ncbi:benzoyl-CoA-dihydrodiol lyase, partial [Sulfobacillus acidophilus]|nr:benzoyl-CoA-dihydrodiol lyase [Sulfobacillus acidophilus]
MIQFETNQSQYKHWHLEIKDQLAFLTLNVREDGGLFNTYKLKLNSYDLSVDIELADAVQRIRFEHPGVKTVVISSDNKEVFCAGANIFMLGQSSHAFKVNFCKFTNETRLAMEDASKNSDLKFLCAASGTTAGGGYELALACDKILLVNDSNSAVSLPEVPLLGVLPGTGGLTRLSDKRKVQKDYADFFCTTAEGIKGERAKKWNLVDYLAPRSNWQNTILEQANELAKQSTRTKQPGVKLEALGEHKYVNLKINEKVRTAEITVHAPFEKEPTTLEETINKGSNLWMLRAFRELENVLLNIRFNYLEVGLLIFKTKGSGEYVLQAEKALVNLAKNKNSNFAKETLLFVKRVFKKIDVTSRSMVTFVEEDSAFAGVLADLIWAADRSYMLADENGKSKVCLSQFNFGKLPMGNNLTRLEARFFGNKEKLAKVSGKKNIWLSAQECEELELVTFVLDDIDYPDETRLFLEERASLSPDSLTGMEANLRFVGPETMETKIFARLSAWQNWIFNRE